MPKRVPQKGSIEWHPLPSAPPDWEKVEIGVLYVGYFKAKEWMYDLQRIYMEERARSLPKGEVSPEFSKEWSMTIEKILTEGTAGMRGVEGLDEKDAKGAVEQVEYLGDDVQLATANLIQEVQRLSPEEQFRPEGAGD